MHMHVSNLLLFTDVCVILLALVQETATRGIEFSGMEHGATRKKVVPKVLSPGNGCPHLARVAFKACQ